MGDANDLMHENKCTLFCRRFRRVITSQYSARIQHIRTSVFEGSKKSTHSWRCEVWVALFTILRACNNEKEDSNAGWCQKVTKIPFECEYVLFFYSKRNSIITLNEEKESSPLIIMLTAMMRNTPRTVILYKSCRLVSRKSVYMATPKV